MVAVNPEKNSSSKELCIAFKQNSLTNSMLTSPKTARDNRFETMTQNARDLSDVNKNRKANGSMKAKVDAFKSQFEII